MGYTVNSSWAQVLFVYFTEQSSLTDKVQLLFIFLSIHVLDGAFYSGVSYLRFRIQGLTRLLWMFSVLSQFPHTLTIFEGFMLGRLYLQTDVYNSYKILLCSRIIFSFGFLRFIGSLKLFFSLRVSVMPIENFLNIGTLQRIM